jgi:hypothetical protein
VIVSFVACASSANMPGMLGAQHLHAALQVETAAATGWDHPIPGLAGRWQTDLTAAAAIGGATLLPALGPDCAWRGQALASGAWPEAARQSWRSLRLPPPTEPPSTERTPASGPIRHLAHLQRGASQRRQLQRSLG